MSPIDQQQSSVVNISVGTNTQRYFNQIYTYLQKKYSAHHKSYIFNEYVCYFWLLLNSLKF